MKLHGIAVNNFMSLASLKMERLDPHTNFIVGPNGSGKTSVFRSVRSLKDAFQAVTGTDRSGNSPRKDALLSDMRLLISHNPLRQELIIEVDVEFDRSSEQELISSFVLAALLHPESIKNGFMQHWRRQNGATLVLNQEQMLMLSDWLATNLGAGDFSSLYRGTIRLTYLPDIVDIFELTYTFSSEGQPLTFRCGWTPYYENGYIYGPHGRRGRYSSLGSDELLFDFFQMAEPGSSQRFLTGSPILEQAPIHVPSLVGFLAEKETVLVVRGVSLPEVYPPHHKRLTELLSVPLRDPNNDRVTFSQIMASLLSDALIFTGESRISVSGKLEVGWEILTGNSRAGDEQHLPIRLYQLKNGNLDDRARFQRIQEVFSSLAGETTSFDVISSPIGGGSNRPALDLEVRIIEGNYEIPLDDHGAGIAEMLTLSALLVDTDQKIVLFDEPALNLHPGMQHRFIDQLRDAPGQYFVVTHSQHLLPTHAAEFVKVTRLSRPTSSGTHCFQLPADGIRGMTSERLEQELNESSDVGGLLFASAVILVEGGTEIAALPEWFPRAVGKGKTLDDLGLALYDVGGKTNIAFYLRFLHAFGIPWAVLCDGDAMRNNSLWSGLRDVDSHAAVQLPQAYDEVRKRAAEVGVFTANDVEADDFELIPEVAAYIKDPANRLPTKSPVRDGRQIGQNIDCPSSVEQALQQIVDRFQSLGALRTPVRS